MTSPPHLRYEGARGRAVPTLRFGSGKGGRGAGRWAGSLVLFNSLESFFLLEHFHDELVLLSRRERTRLLQVLPGLVEGVTSDSNESNQGASKHPEERHLHRPYLNPEVILVTYGLLVVDGSLLVVM